MRARRNSVRLLGGLVMSMIGAGASAQADYPNRPIRYITPYAPGGSTSFTARLVGQQLTEAWGQQVVVDNRSGGNTLIGTSLALKSPSDGYTLLAIGATLASNHTLVKTPYDPFKDLACIATVLTYENVLVVPPTLPVKTVKDLIAFAKARPGKLTYGTNTGYPDGSSGEAKLYDDCDDTTGRQLGSPPVSEGAGHLYSSSEDLFLWDQALYTGQLLPQPELEQVFVPLLPPSVVPGFDEVNRRLLGESSGQPVLATAGGGEGSPFGTLLARFPQNRLTVIVLANQYMNQIYFGGLIVNELFSKK